MKHPTQRDIARLAGVSRTTVSYVLSGRQDGQARISQATRERVLAIAEQLGYRPNAIARSLRLQRTHILTLIIPDIANPFYPALTRGFQDVTRPHGYQTVVLNTDNVPSQEREAIEAVLRQRSDGVLLVAFHLGAQEIGRLIDAGVAVVTLGHSRHPMADSVYADDKDGARKAVRYLLERGHRRIAHIAGRLDTPPGRSRYEGYRQALSEYGIPIDEALVMEGDFTRGCGRTCLRRLMDLPDPPTALFAANDIMAIDALLEAQDMGLSVPDDIAIVGFDDIPEATIVRPQLTTVPQHPYLMGQYAGTFVVERLAGGDDALPPRCQRIELELVVRDSA